MDAHDEKYPEGILPSWRTVTAGDELEREGVDSEPCWFSCSIGRSEWPDADDLCGALILFGFS